MLCTGTWVDQIMVSFVLHQIEAVKRYLSLQMCQLSLPSFERDPASVNRRLDLLMYKLFEM